LKLNHPNYFKGTKMNIFTKFIAVVTLLALQTSAHAGSQSLSIFEGQPTKIQLQLPNSWNATHEQQNTIRISSTEGPKFSFLITAFPLSLEKQKTTNVRDLAQFEADRIGPMSENSPLVVKTFGDSKVQGAYFRSTDSAPKPGEFKYMQQVMMSVDGALVIATVLTNESKDAIEKQALEAVKLIRFSPN
jgi:hypothetical protein